MAGEREAVAMATCWQLLSLCLESTGCSLSTQRLGGRGGEGGEGWREGEGGERRKEVRRESLGGVGLPKGNNTRSLRHKTKGLLAGKRATKEQH